MTADVDNIIRNVNSRMFCLRKIGGFVVRTENLKKDPVNDYGSMALLLNLLD